MVGFKKIALSLFLLPLIFFSFFKGIDHFFPLNLTKYHQPSFLFLSSEGKILHCSQSMDEKWRLPVSLDKIDPLYIQWLLEKEDKNFYSHWGIDWGALIRAFSQNIRSRQIVSGASTITMQTARLLEPRPRTYFSKIIEMIRAFQLEYHFTKKEILTIYLNLIPFGGNIEGIRSASLAYLKKEPHSFLFSEIASFIAIPQSPTQLRPDYFPLNLQRKRNDILEFYYQKGWINKQDKEEGQQETPLSKRYPYPQLIPHLARFLEKKPQKIYKTTLSFHDQQMLNTLLKKSESDIPKGANIAALIVDHHRQSVLAYGGSSDFFNKERQGQVDYIQAIRSPGSTLKPFIFGLAFDEGLIEPETLFKDERQHFGAYAPHNFDRSYHGVLPASHSLQLSLNIPAVDLLNKLGPIKFYASLKNASIPLYFKNHETKPNLSMALGGVGIKLWDLVKLYTALSHEGNVHDILFVQNQLPSFPHSLLYPNSAQKITDILHYNPLTRFHKQNARKIALKTGTSYGYRDALAIGYDHDYTIGVWVGKPQGESLGDKTGFELAVPILRQIFNFLPPLESPSQKEPLNVTNLTPFKLKPQLKEHVFISKEEMSKPALKIMFPLNNSILYQFDSSQAFHIEIKGGEKPFRLFCNNQLYEENIYMSKIKWMPFSAGFYILTIQDKKGEIDSISIEIES